MPSSRVLHGGSGPFGLAIDMPGCVPGYWERLGADDNLGTCHGQTTSALLVRDCSRGEGGLMI
jgi:hypothetical protein